MGQATPPAGKYRQTDAAVCVECGQSIQRSRNPRTTWHHVWTGRISCDIPEPAATEPAVMCDDCDQRHEATYSHDTPFGEPRPVYAVVCPVSGLTDYYLTERLVP